MMKAAPALRHSKCKKPAAERGWPEMQSGWGDMRHLKEKPQASNAR